MIELSQAAQCLFCPQRRKIALLLKVMMAASAAIIMGLILFLPQARRAPAPQTSGPTGGLSLAATAATPVEGVAQDAASRKSAEIREQAQKRFQEVQILLRPLLTASPARLTEAREILERRRKEVLTAKLLVLGEDLFSGSSRAEAHKLVALEALEKELGVLSEQAKLLNQLMRPGAEPPALPASPPVPPRR